jgi:hypothetical protein
MQEFGVTYLSTYIHIHTYMQIIHAYISSHMQTTYMNAYRSVIQKYAQKHILNYIHTGDIHTGDIHTYRTAYIHAYLYSLYIHMVMIKTCNVCTDIAKYKHTCKYRHTHKYTLTRIHHYTLRKNSTIIKTNAFFTLNSWQIFSGNLKTHGLYKSNYACLSVGQFAECAKSIGASSSHSCSIQT